jgi:hypothetical protein
MAFSLAVKVVATAVAEASSRSPFLWHPAAQANQTLNIINRKSLRALIKTSSGSKNAILPVKFFREERSQTAL